MNGFPFPKPIRGVNGINMWNMTPIRNALVTSIRMPDQKWHYCSPIVRHLWEGSCCCLTACALGWHLDDMEHLRLPSLSVTLGFTSTITFKDRRLGRVKDRSVLPWTSSSFIILQKTIFGETPLPTRKLPCQSFASSVLISCKEIGVWLCSPPQRKTAKRERGWGQPVVDTVATTCVPDWLTQIREIYISPPYRQILGLTRNHTAC